MAGPDAMNDTSSCSLSILCEPQRTYMTFPGVHFMRVVRSTRRSRTVRGGL